MGTRNLKSGRKVQVYSASSNIDCFIERLRRIRALNGDPALFGMDHYVLKRLQFNKLNVLTKS
jgi:hypothetical protein